MLEEMANARIAIVRSSYYPELLSTLEESARAALRGAGVAAGNIAVTEVPGAFEIPLACQSIAEGKHVGGIIALGVIVQGETHHAAEIARACTDGMMEVMLRSGIPIAHGVLFVDSLSAAEQRCRGKGNKGAEAARTLLQMLEMQRGLHEESGHAL